MNILSNDNYIVTGLPRSGTALTMQLLRAGGIPISYEEEFDKMWTNNPNWGEPNYHPNPHGNFCFQEELYTTKQLLEINKGKFFRYIALENLPYFPIGKYHIILVERNLLEIKKSFEITFTKYSMPISVIQEWKNILEELKKKLSERKDMNLLAINFNDLHSSPQEELSKIRKFLGNNFDETKALGVIDSKLYRNKHETSK